MSDLTPNEYLTMLRNDFFTFVDGSFRQLNPGAEFLPNWHIELIAAELERCFRGETKRLIINVPPRSLKSHCASVAFPAWLLGHKPSSEIICVSYGQDLADKARPRLSLADELRVVRQSICDSSCKSGCRRAHD